jgi:chaperonin GroEL (HSP60 family)
MNVVRNLVKDPRIVPGGGASEMALSHAVIEKSKLIKGIMQDPFRAIGQALEVIPRTLADNCGVKTIKVLTELRVNFFLKLNIFLKRQNILKVKIVLGELMEIQVNLQIWKN